MIKIKLVTSEPHGACSYYRTLGVFSKLHKINPEIDVEFITDVNWNTLAGADILYIERPFMAMHTSIISIARDMNIKVWVDIDDDVFCLPEWSPSYKLLTTNEVFWNTKQCVRLADIVTVTTERLRQVYSQLNPETYVIENAFNDYNFSLPEFPSNRKIINWRGSDFHRGDLISFFKQIKKFSELNEDWKWNFIGNTDNRLWYIVEHMRCTFMDELPINTYFRVMSEELFPAVQVSPLMDIPFNYGKSNIAWIEGILAGACHVGPDFPEFQKPGIINYNGPDDFYDKLEVITFEDKVREECFIASRDYINSELKLSFINHKRVEIISKLHDRFIPYMVSCENNPVIESCDTGKFFIAIYTGHPKRYCDTEFLKNLSIFAGNAEVHIVDNTLGFDGYFRRLNKLCEDVLWNCNWRVHRVEVEAGELFFQRAVYESVNYLRELFLRSDCDYFLTVESDVLPPVDALYLLEKASETYDIVGGIYYPPEHHKPEWFDAEFNMLIESSRVFSGCTLYPRRVIQNIEFRYDPEDPRNFPDTFFSWDAIEKGYTMCLDTGVKCDHLHDAKGRRGHHEVTL